MLLVAWVCAHRPASQLRCASPALYHLRSFAAAGISVPALAKKRKDGAPTVSVLQSSFKRGPPALLFDIPLPLSFVRNHTRTCSECGEQVKPALFYSDAADTTFVPLRITRWVCVRGSRRPSQTARRTGHPLCWRCQRDLKPGPPALCLPGSWWVGCHVPPPLVNPRSTSGTRPSTP